MDRSNPNPGGNVEDQARTKHGGPSGRVDPASGDRVALAHGLNALTTLLDQLADQLGAHVEEQRTVVDPALAVKSALAIALGRGKLRHADAESVVVLDMRRPGSPLPRANETTLTSLLFRLLLDADQARSTSIVVGIDQVDDYMAVSISRDVPVDGDGATRGVPKRDALDSLFEPPTGQVASLSEAARMGLADAWTEAHQAGASLRFDRQPNAGTAVTVRLPVRG